MSIRSSVRMCQAEMFDLIREYLQNGPSQKQFYCAKSLFRRTATSNGQYSLSLPISPEAYKSN